MRRLLLISFVLISVCIAVPTVEAQTIRGLLISGTTGEPLYGAEVTLLDTLGGIVATVQSDSGGVFQLPVEAGSFAFRVRRVGYAPTMTEPFDVPEGAAIIRVRIELAEAEALPPNNPFMLAPIIVEAQPVERHLAAFYRRRAVGMGDFALRAEFERWNPQNATDVIRRMPSFLVSLNPTYGLLMSDGTVDTRRYRIETATRSRGMGECPPLLYLDGAFIGDSRSFDITDIPIGAVEAVETYSRAAQTPVEFSRPGSRCGVVALWTPSGLSGENTSTFEIGARFGASITEGDFGWGRVGIHFVTAFIGPLELYPAFHFMVNVPSRGGGWADSGWHAQVAVRAWPIGDRAPWYIGTGLVVTKRKQTYQGLQLQAPGSSDAWGADAGYTLFTGVALSLGPARPFAEVHVLDLFTFSSLEALVFSGIGFQF